MRALMISDVYFPWVNGVSTAVLANARGACVVPEDVDQFAARVIELLQSPGQRAALSERARATATDWSGETMARRLLDIYRGLAPSAARACASGA